MDRGDGRGKLLVSTSCLHYSALHISLHFQTLLYSHTEPPGEPSLVPNWICDCSLFQTSTLLYSRPTWLGFFALSYLVQSFNLTICYLVLDPWGCTICILFYLLSHAWNSWTHRSFLLIEGNHKSFLPALLLLFFGAASSVHSQMLLTRLCFCFSSVSFTHLWTWCMTGRGPCRPGGGREERKAKKWTLPWWASSAFLGLALGNVRGLCHCLNGRCV